MLDLLGFVEVRLVFFNTHIGIVLNLGRPLGNNDMLLSWRLRCSEHATMMLLVLLRKNCLVPVFLIRTTNRIFNRSWLG